MVASVNGFLFLTQSCFGFSGCILWVDTLFQFSASPIGGYLFLFCRVFSPHPIRLCRRMWVEIILHDMPHDGVTGSSVSLFFLLHYSYTLRFPSSVKFSFMVYGFWVIIRGNVSFSFFFMGFYSGFSFTQHTQKALTCIPPFCSLSRTTTAHFTLGFSVRAFLFLGQ